MIEEVRNLPDSPNKFAMLRLTDEELDIIHREHDDLSSFEEIRTIADAQLAKMLAYEIECPRCIGMGEPEGVFCFDTCCGRYTGCEYCGGKRLDRGVLDSGEVPVEFRGTGRITIGRMLEEQGCRA